MVRHNHQSRVRWLATFVLVLAVQPVATAQEEEDSPRPVAPFPNSFGKFVKPSASPRPSEGDDPAPSNPNPDGNGLGGLFMPLKSISNPFRANPKRIASDSAPNPPRKTFREPFQEPQDPAASNATKPVVAPKPPTASEKMTRPLHAPGTNPTGATQTAEVSTTSERTSDPKSYAANPRIDTFDSKKTSRRVRSATVSQISERRSKDSNSDEPEQDDASPASPIAKPNPTQRDEASRDATPATPERATPLSKSPKNKSNRPTATPPSHSGTPGGMNLHTPGLHLKWVGPDSILIGKTVPYELLATNEGQTPLHGLSIRIVVPANVVLADPKVTDGKLQETTVNTSRGLIWEVNQLPVGSTRSLQVMIQAEQPQHFAVSMDWKIENPPIEIPIRVQQPQLILALEGPSEADFGKPQTYRLRVRNPGNAAAEGVTVQLEAQPNSRSEQNLGDLPAGSERVIEIELTFEQVGKVPVFAKATSTQSNLEANQAIDVEVRQSQLLSTWDGPSDFYQGNIAEFNLNLENRGSIDALSNQCQIDLPSGIEVVTLPQGVSRIENQLQWSIPRIAVGESKNWKFQFAMNQTGKQELSFAASSSTGEPVRSAIQTNVDAVADLSLSVTDPISPAPIGKPVQYQITITNRGKKTAEDVFVIAQFSDGIEPLRIEGHSGTLVPGQVLFDNIPKIEPGQELTLVVTAEASRSGSHRFRAAVRCQGSEDDLLKEESTRYAATGSGPATSK